MHNTPLLAPLIYCPCGKTHDMSQPLLDFSAEALERAAETLTRAGMPASLHVAADRNTLGACPGLLELLTAGGFTVTLTLFDNLLGGCVKDARRIQTEAAQADGFLAVGTGSLHDLCRFAAYETGKPLALIATAPSMDGFASTISPMLEDGFKVTMPGVAPRCIIGPTGVLSASPLPLRAAGFGDIVGKITALFDWQVSHLVSGEYYCPRVHGLVDEALRQTLTLARGVKEGAPDAMEALMRALTLSGLCIQASGLSRPASGGEHHMAHYWEMRAVGAGRTPAFHGAEVGAATPLLIALYKRLTMGPCPELTLPAFPEAALRENFGAIYPQIRNENEPDPLAALDLAHLRAVWPNIAALAKALPDPSDICAILRAAGAPATPEELGLPSDWSADAIRYGRFVRRRITLLRLSSLFG